MASQTKIFVSTSDVSSLVTLFSITHGYEAEANLHFSERGFGLKFSTSDNLAMIDFESDEHKLLGYYYEMSEPISYVGVCLKKCYTLLRGIPAKSVGQIYKMDGDDDLYINSEGSSSIESASKIPTVHLTVENINPPIIEQNDPYIKVNTSDFATMCTAISKSDCKIIKFITKNSCLCIRGFNDRNECMCAFSYRNVGPNEDDEDIEEIVDAHNQSKIRKGKINVIIRKKISSDQHTIETTIDKLKPLSKINNLCKNGILYVRVHQEKGTRRDKTISLKVNVGQIGTFTVYLRDSSRYNNYTASNTGRNHGFYS